MTVIHNYIGGLRLGWAFTDSCCFRQYIELTYWDPDGTERIKTVHPNATRFDINNLQSSTTYKASFILHYDQGTSDTVWFQFRTGKLTNYIVIEECFIFFLFSPAFINNYNVELCSAVLEKKSFFFCKSEVRAAILVF